LIPHSQHFLDEATTNEPAALELGCIVNDIRHIIVCGHSDCKVNVIHLGQLSHCQNMQGLSI